MLLKLLCATVLPSNSLTDNVSLLLLLLLSCVCIIQVIVAERGPLVFVFNWHPHEDYEGLKVPAPEPGTLVTCYHSCYQRCYFVKVTNPLWLLSFSANARQQPLFSELPLLPATRTPSSASSTAAAAATLLLLLLFVTRQVQGCYGQ